MIECVMPISDDDFVRFYQSLMQELWAEGGDFMFSLVGFPESDHDMAWYQNALDAMTRLTRTGLAEFREDGMTNEECLQDIVALQKDFQPNSNGLRFPYFLYETERGNALLDEYNLKTYEGYTPVPEFREALSRIFDEAGVGFDAELPYKMQF